MYQIRLPSPQLLGVELQDKQGDTYEMTFKILFLDKLGKCEDEKILLNRSWKMKKLKKKFENHNT